MSTSSTSISGSGPAEDSAEYLLIKDLGNRSDNELIGLAAVYGAKVRLGEQMMTEGELLILNNKHLKNICENELRARIQRRIAREIERELGR
jgi:trehalose-6-phosphatase